MSVRSSCQHCGAGFEHKASRAARYCGNACRGAAQRASRPTLVCEQCKATFQPEPRRAGKRRYCSKICRASWQASLPASQWRDKISASRQGKLTGRENPAYGRSPVLRNGFSYVARDGRRLALRSSWEMATARFLDARGIRWEYEARRFEMPSGGTFAPDFFMPDLNVFWEVKGWSGFRQARRIAEFRRAFPALPLIVIGPGSIRGLAAATETE